MGRPKEFDPETAVARASEAFRRHSYTDISPRELAESMGIGKGSLYHAFQNKHELFLRSLRHYADASLEELKAIMEDDAPIRERVTRMLTTFLDTDFEDPNHCGCLVVNSAVEIGGRDEAAAEVLRQSFAATESVLHTALGAAQSNGEIAADRDPKALAGLLQSAMVGLRVLVKTVDDRDRLAAIVTATVAAI